MEWKEFETTFSVKLNQQQKEAVQSTKGCSELSSRSERFDQKSA